MSEPLTVNEYTPAIHLVFSDQDFRILANHALPQKIASIESTVEPENISVNWSVKNPNACSGEIHFKDHRVQVAGLPAPLPKAIIDRTIHVSLWQPQIKAAMRQHLSHLSFVYNGDNPDPVEQMIALYEVAYAFGNENLLGIVNEQAWTAHPVADFLDPGKLISYRQVIPFKLWVGYVKFYVDKQHYWLVTKGHHIFDVPDLAAFVESEEDFEKIMGQFINIFNYLYNNDVVVTAGDTVEIQQTGQYLRFSEVTEYPEFLMGPSGTLVIEAIDANDITP